MAAVARPRNNLQEHLAWFHSQQPQIPPQGQGMEYLQTGSAATTATLQVQVVNRGPAARIEPVLNTPTQPALRNPSTQIQHTESWRQQQKVEFIAPKEISVPTLNQVGAIKRFKSDDTRTGALLVVFQLTS
jgi:hypothetical protein